MKKMDKNKKTTNDNITGIILEAKEKAYAGSSVTVESEAPQKSIQWPIECTIGPGLEGAVACESSVGFVNGTQGLLFYRGYDIFDLCAYSTYEEVSYLLLNGKLPTAGELQLYKIKLSEYRHLPDVKRLLMGFPVEKMNTMAALRLGTNLMRQKQTYRDIERNDQPGYGISTDEDSIPMETLPKGEEEAIYGFKQKWYTPPPNAEPTMRGSEGLESCYHLIAGVGSIVGAIARLRQGRLPLEPDPELSHAGNLLYVITGRPPTPLEERIMDVCLILHADHGMNASTFAAMVVASTLSDIYFSIGAGIAALNGPLHGGANEKVMKALEEIGTVSNVKKWFEDKRKNREKIMGFGHRVYKAYDPRARVLSPLASLLFAEREKTAKKYDVARELEALVVSALGDEKGIFPNVDFFSGLVYEALGIPVEFFTPIFAVARTAGWTARVLEYLKNNRIFRPRAIYTGEYNLPFVPIEKR